MVHCKKNQAKKKSRVGIFQLFNTESNLELFAFAVLCIHYLSHIDRHLKNLLFLFQVIILFRGGVRYFLGM